MAASAQADFAPLNIINGNLLHFLTEKKVGFEVADANNKTIDV